MAAVHGRGAGETYDVEALVAGRDWLRETEAAAAGEVAGLDVLHVQCHVGFETISLARRGARVTGVDFSPVALATARELAARCGVEVDFVEADATALPASLAERFDLVFASIGVISWIEDLGAWFRAAAGTLRPGGRLALVDLHPLYDVIGTLEPLTLDFPYAFDGPRRFDEPGSYADPDAPVQATATVNYGHSLGEVVGAAIAAGLRIDGLEEHLEAEFDPRGTMLPRDADGRYRLRVSGELLPFLFTLRASRPG